MSFSVHCSYIRDASSECIGYELYLKSFSGMKNVVGHASKKFDDSSVNGQEYFEFRPVKRLDSVISGGQFRRMRQLKEMLRQHSDELMSRFPLPIKLFYVPNNDDFTHVAPDHLKSLNKRIQRKIMLYWVHSNFSNPEDYILFNEHESDIHDYLYDIRYEIYIKFSGYASDEVIEQVVNQVVHASTKWVSNSIRRNYKNDPDYKHHNTEPESEFSHNKINPSELNGLKEEEIADYIERWFRYFYCQPGGVTPYDDEDGKYLYIYGGPYDAEEHIERMFADTVPQKIIEVVVKRLNQEAYKWAPTPKHPSYLNYYYDELISPSNDNDNDDNNKNLNFLDEIESRYNSSITSGIGSDAEIKKRTELGPIIDDTTKELDKLKPTHGGIGHNNPPASSIGNYNVINEVRGVVINIGIEIKSLNLGLNLQKIIELTGVIKKALSWLGKKLKIKTANFMLQARYKLAKVSNKMDAAVWSKIISVYDAIISWLSTAVGL